jgi:hypothetical protein
LQTTTMTFMALVSLLRAAQASDEFAAQSHR